MTSDFKQFGLPEALVLTLEGLKITTPTPVQEATIPVALDGHDILASAQTGTGKTIAFAVPVIINLIKNPNSMALILAPTRELAAQVHLRLMQILGKSGHFTSALLIGGDPMGKQMMQLKRRPQLIVGTPGRINDHLDRGSLKLDKTSILVIDEADRMLDMGFGIQLDAIAEYLPVKRQTMMFSATVPPTIEKLSRKYLRDPKRITIGSTTQAVPKIKQEVIHTSGHDKMQHLLKELEARQGSIIIFVKTKRGTERLARDLERLGHSADAIHGDLHQRRREKVIEGFRNKKSRIMVATDVAARGLDVPHIMHVINYDLPQCPEDYIHRIGRTGRAGAEGSALCLICPEDVIRWRSIQRLMNPGEKIERTGMDRRTERGPTGPRKSRFGGRSSFKFGGRR